MGYFVCSFKMYFENCCWKHTVVETDREQLQSFAVLKQGFGNQNTWLADGLLCIFRCFAMIL